MVFKEDAVKMHFQNCLLWGQRVVAVIGVGVCACLCVRMRVDGIKTLADLLL